MPTSKRRSSRKFRAAHENANPCIEYIRQASGGELAALLHQIAQRTVQLTTSPPGVIDSGGGDPREDGGFQPGWKPPGYR